MLSPPAVSSRKHPLQYQVKEHLDKCQRRQAFPAQIYQFAEERGWKVRVEPDFDRALDVVSREAATVLITGSFHTVGDAMSRLQVSPLAE